MGVKIIFKNKKFYKGERKADIVINSTRNLKSINCPSKLNSSAIDEFLVIFQLQLKLKVSYFKGLSELNQKKVLDFMWAEKILSKMGVKTVTTNDSIKIYGNPNLTINKTIIIKNFLKDHRIFMTSVIAGFIFWREMDYS